MKEELQLASQLEQNNPKKKSEEKKSEYEYELKLYTDATESQRESRFKNPLDFAIYLFYSCDRKDYEAMIPLLEANVLDKIKILQSYELSLRGDCLPRNAAEKPTDIEGRVMCAVRNQKLNPESEKDKIAILGALLSEIVYRTSVAEHYENKNIEDGKSGMIPGIIYGFQRFSADTKYANLSDDYFRVHAQDKFFYGHADDIGNLLRNVNFLSLPQKRETDHSEIREFFPTVSMTIDKPPSKERLSKEDKRRIKRFTENKDLAPYHIGMILQLAKHKTYFHSLLYAHKILSDIEYFDKNGKH